MMAHTKKCCSTLYLWCFIVMMINNIPAVLGNELEVFNNICHLHAAKEEELYNTVSSLLKSGSKLIEYNITFHPSSSIPTYGNLDTIGSTNYKTSQWKRVSSRHGQTLLTLAFNYDVLSLTMLTFGVEKLDVEILDVPGGCFYNLTEEKQIVAIKNLVMHDFKSHVKDTVWLDDNDFACHQVIRRRNTHAVFVHECCTRTKTTHSVVCTDSHPNIWVSLMYQILRLIDYLFFLFAPAFVLGIFYGNSYRVASYIVQLKNPHIVTIKKDALPAKQPPSNIKPAKTKNLDTVSKIKPEYTQSISEEAQYYKKKYVECISKIPCNHKSKVSMSQFYIQVDHKALMTEKEVNVGLLSFLWSNLILCNIQRYQPFTSCCSQSIFGTWGNTFLCAVLPQQNKLFKTFKRLNRRWKSKLSWKSLLKTFTLTVLVAFVPFPYYLRIVFFIYNEADEVMAQKAAAEALNLHIQPQSNFYVMFSPRHPLYTTMLCLYFCTSVIILVIMRKNKIKFLEYVVSILQDVKHIKRLESFRTLSFHFILPFEKFGLFGFIVGPVYWIFAMPVCVAIILYYCVPTLYLIGRFLLPSKPKYIDTNFRRGNIHNDEDDQNIEIVYDTIEKAMFLSKISPRPDERLPAKPLGKDGTLTTSKPTNYKAITKFLIGVVLCIWMVSLLILFSECFGFITEVLTLSFMGAIVNAGSAGQYFMLLFFLVTYTLSVLNTVQDKYQKLASNVFQHIKEKLSNDLDDAILYNNQQLNLAFKYFSTKEVLDLCKQRYLYVGPRIASMNQDELPEKYRDVFEIKDRKLHWNVKNVILFLDKFDVPRIPRALFEQIMHIQCPGCPGPLHLSLLSACARLLYMFLFLFFVVVVVMTFGDAYKISTTNQLLLTLAGGFVPFFIGNVLKPKDVNLNLSSYSFRGKVHEIISGYYDRWPVYDLDFQLCEDMVTPCNAFTPTKDNTSVVDHEISSKGTTNNNKTPDLKKDKKIESTSDDDNNDDDIIIPKLTTPLTSAPPQLVLDKVDGKKNFQTPGTFDGNLYQEPVQLYRIETNREGDTDLVLHMHDVQSSWQNNADDHCVIS